MGRSFLVNGFSDRKIHRAAERSAEAREGLIGSLTGSGKRVPGSDESFAERAERMGVNEEGLENIRRFSRAMRHDEPATLQRGVAGPMMVRGEVFQGTDVHTNSNGERVTEAYRRNGPRWEKVRVVESFYDRHTRVVSRVEGGR